MPTFPIKIKHAGTVYSDILLDTDAPPALFLHAVSERTSVPLERLKIMVKGGVLKEDSDWKKIAPKEGQTFMAIGAAGELPKPPSKPVVFLEDMDDSQLAKALQYPAGMHNLGNTCYMNASLQVMRAIPELQTALQNYGPPTIAQPEVTGIQGNATLTRALQNMYAALGTSGDAYNPTSFLSALRMAVPQFAERDRSEKGAKFGALYAQQDAEECWSQVLNALKALPGKALERGDAGAASTAALTSAQKSFIEQFMMVQMRREWRCIEAPEEPPSVSYYDVLKIDCNINRETSFMQTGIMTALDQKIQKISPTLGRETEYSEVTRLSRIPTNLTVHMVRFAWKRDVEKKAKIMRKVKFPLEFDVLDLCTEELKQKLLPVNTRLKEIERDRAERRKVRKRTKTAVTSSKEDKMDVDVDAKDHAPAAAAAAAASGPPAMLQAPVPAGAEPSDTEAKAAREVPEKAKSAAAEMAKNGGGLSSDSAAATSSAGAAGEALGPEWEYRERELAELQALVPEDVRDDVGASQSGLYELIGIVTHKGAEADAGHYIGFVKRSALHAVKSAGEDSGQEQAAGDAGRPEKGKEKERENAIERDDEDWYKFDDDKVSIFPVEKLSTLEGGGEDASAYVLLYRSKPFA